MRVILACLLFLGLALAKPDGYTTKYDNVDLDEVLHNDRLYKKYFDCLANKGPCTPDGKELKDIEYEEVPPDREEIIEILMAQFWIKKKS